MKVKVKMKLKSYTRTHSCRDIAIYILRYRNILSRYRNLYIAIYIAISIYCDRDIVIYRNCDRNIASKYIGIFWLITNPMTNKNCHVSSEYKYIAQYITQYISQFKLRYISRYRPITNPRSCMDAKTLNMSPEDFGQKKCQPDSRFADRWPVPAQITIPEIQFHSFPPSPNFFYHLGVPVLCLPQ